MRKMTRMLAIIVILLWTCKHQPPAPLVVCEKIQFAVSVASGSADLDYWVNNMEGPVREAFVNRVLEAVRSGKTVGYDARKRPIAAGQLDHYLSGITILSVAANGVAADPDAVFETPFSPEQVDQIVCLEKWTIDAHSLEMKKQVFGFGLAVMEAGAQPAVREVLWVLADTAKQKSAQLVRVVDKIQYDVSINSGDNGKDWFKDNLVTSKRIEFLDLFFQQVYQGHVQTYNYFNRPMTAEQVRLMEHYTDTVAMQDPEPPYHYKDTVIAHTLNTDIVTRMRFIETWSLDENTFELHKTVKGMVPLKENYSNEGVFRGYTPMFWVYFDKDLLL